MDNYGDVSSRFDDAWKELCNMLDLEYNSYNPQNVLDTVQELVDDEFDDVTY